MGGAALEDIISKGADWLEKYDEMKRKNILPLELRDINRLTFQQLHKVISDPALGGALEAEKLKVIPKGQSKTIINNEVVRVIQPLDEEAAKYYGNGTTWCTAATNNNMFSSYNKDGPMFILLPKQPQHVGEKYQVHAVSGQFMDEQDDPVSPLIVIRERFGDLLSIFKQADPIFTWLVMFADDSVLEKLINQVKEFSLDHIHEILSDWESQDDSYYQFLKDGGYVNDDGDISEDAPTYFDYNPDAEEQYDMLVSAVNLSPRELRDAAVEYASDENENPTLGDFEHIVAYAILYNRNRSEKHNLNHLAEWIGHNLYVQDNVIKRLGSRFNP